MLTLVVFLLCTASCVSASAKGESMSCCDFYYFLCAGIFCGSGVFLSYES